MVRSSRKYLPDGGKEIGRSEPNVLKLFRCWNDDFRTENRLYSFTMLKYLDDKFFGLTLVDGNGFSYDPHQEKWGLWTYMLHYRLVGSKSSQVKFCLFIHCLKDVSDVFRNLAEKLLLANSLLADIPSETDITVKMPSTEILLNNWKNNLTEILMKCDSIKDLDFNIESYPDEYSYIEALFRELTPEDVEHLLIQK